MSTSSVLPIIGACIKGCNHDNTRGMLVSLTALVEDVSVRVDVDLAHGRPDKTIVIGVPEQLAMETMQKVQQTILSRGFSLPAGRVVVSISPAVERSFPAINAAIADALLMASGQVRRR